MGVNGGGVFTEMLPTERIGKATWLLAQGRAMTVRELAETLEMTHSGASKLLDRLSRVLPLVVDDGDNGGVWRINSGEPDPFEYDDPHDIRHALARHDQRMMEEKRPIVDG